jgi:hypothetical protein
MRAENPQGEHHFKTQRVFAKYTIARVFNPREMSNLLWQKRPGPLEITFPLPGCLPRSIFPAFGRALTPYPNRNPA